MIDWHSHILTGIDDGPSDMEQSISLALLRGSYDATNDAVCLAVAELQERLNIDGIPLTLFAGREYCLDEYLLTALQNPLPLGNSKLILVEIPSHISAGMVRNLAYDVVRSGFTPVIAHPERCPLLAPSENGRLGIYDRYGSDLHSPGQVKMVLGGPPPS